MKTPLLPSSVRQLAALAGAVLALWITTATSKADRIQLQGGASLDTGIANGDQTPLVNDGTDFGIVDTEGAQVTHTFRIRNLDAELATQIDVTEISSSNPRFEILNGFASPGIPIVIGGGGVIGPGGDPGALSRHDFRVRFDPTAAGPQDATITIRSNADIPVFTFLVRGEGLTAVEPEIGIMGLSGSNAANLQSIVSGDNPPSAGNGTKLGRVTVFGTVSSSSFRITNSGSATLTLSMSGNLSPPFSLSSLAASIPPGGSDDFSIRCTPITGGLFTEQVSLITNDLDGGESPFIFNVECYAELPEIQATGGAALDVPINSGDATPNTTDGTNFGQKRIFGGSVLKTFRISNLFRPTAPNVAGPDSRLSITSIALSSTANFTIRSGAVGASPILIRSASDTISTAPLQHDIVVSYDPSATGVHTTTLRITCNDLDEPLYTFNLTGEGIAVPLFTVFGDPVMAPNGVLTSIPDGDTTPSSAQGTAFGNIGTSTSNTRIFRIVNPGDLPLTMSITSSNPSFTITELPDVIAQDGTDYFKITFLPIDGGFQNSTIRLTANNNAVAHSFVVSSSSAKPEIEVSGGSPALGIEDGNRLPEQRFGTLLPDVIQNNGSSESKFIIRNLAFQTALLLGDLPPTNLRIFLISSSDSSQFIVQGADQALQVADLYPMNANVSPPLLTSLQFKVIFRPTSNGRKTATITIRSNDATENPYTFAVSGTATNQIVPVTASSNPVISSFSFTATQKQLVFTGIAGRTYRVMSSPDLVVWTHVTSIPNIAVPINAAGQAQPATVDLSSIPINPLQRKGFFRLQEP
jgi:hypothetical protein